MLVLCFGLFCWRNGGGVVICKCLEMVLKKKVFVIFCGGG